MKRGKKTLVALIAAVCLSACSLSGIPGNVASAATKRTAISESLLLSSGKINKADWQTAGNAEKFAVTNNGNVYRFAPAAFPGNRIMAFDTVGKGDFSMAFDVVKMDPATTKINLSGFTEGVNSGAKSNVFMSSLGFEPGAGTFWTEDPTIYDPATGEVSSIKNMSLESGYSYRFKFSINSENPERGDLYMGKVAIGSEMTDSILLKKFFAVSDVDHYAMLYAEGNLCMIDNFAVKKGASETVCDLNFNDASKLSSAVTPIEGGIFQSGGGIASDVYLTLSEPSAADRVVTQLAVKKDAQSAEAVSLSASVRLDGTFGKSGILFGMADKNTAIGAASTSLLYFIQEGASTKVNVVTGSSAGTAQDLGVDLTKAFTSLSIRIKTDGTLTVSVAAEQKATFSGCKFEGLIGLVTDGTAGAKLSFEPNLTIDNFEYVVGEGADAENNFNSGWINPDDFIVDGHPAPTLGTSGNDIVVKDGALLFDGTSDGTHFALPGTYADFILQFDWINYDWADRPTKEDGTVYSKPKPADGRGTELYSPLGICFGKSAPSAAWTDGVLLRLFDELNLIQDNTHGVNVTMGKSFGSVADIMDIQPGKIDLYENTVNIKLVVRNNVVQVYGAIVTDSNKTPEHLLLATFAAENYKGFISISTTEAAYFGLDNFRVTKIDGWTDQQLSAYQNYKTIADETKPDPVKLTAPVLTLSDKTVTWEEIPNATGYEVYVNGTKQGETVAVCTYTFDKTEAGDYAVTVVALGDGDLYLSSDKSAAVNVKIPAGGKPGGDDVEEETGCNSGCNDSGATAAIALALAMGAAIVIKRR